MNHVWLELLKALDSVCQKHQLQYFAYGNLLIGCVHYQNFIPNQPEQKIEVGVLRPDYEALLPVLRAEASQYGVELQEYYPNTNIHLPMVQLAKQVGGEEISIGIAVLDVASREFDFRDAYYDRMDRANAMYERICIAHGCVNAQSRPLVALAKKLLYGWRKPQKAFRKVHKKAATYWGRDNMTAVRKVVNGRGKLIFMDQLFPLQRLPFCDMMLPCPKDYSPWTVLPDEALMQQIQTIQKVDLLLLKEFDRVCRLLDIGYFCTIINTNTFFGDTI